MNPSIIAAVIIRIVGLILAAQNLFVIISLSVLWGNAPLPPVIPMITPLLVELLAVIFAKPLGKLVTFDFKE